MGGWLGFSLMIVIRTHVWQCELGYMTRMLSAWMAYNRGRIESIPHERGGIPLLLYEVGECASDPMRKKLPAARSRQLATFDQPFTASLNDQLSSESASMIARATSSHRNGRRSIAGYRVPHAGQRRSSALALNLLHASVYPAWTGPALPSI